VKNDLFLREGLDTPNQLEFARQIKVYVKSNFRRRGGMRTAIAVGNLPVRQISAVARCRRSTKDEAVERSETRHLAAYTDVIDIAEFIIGRAFA
jgi:hypothetical protein